MKAKISYVENFGFILEIFPKSGYLRPRPSSKFQPKPKSKPDFSVPVKISDRNLGPMPEMTYVAAFGLP